MGDEANYIKRLEAEINVFKIEREESLSHIKDKVKQY